MKLLYKCLVFSILLMFLSCNRSPNIKFKGKQIGAWECIDSTLSLKNIIFEDSNNLVIETFETIAASPKYYGDKNKAGILGDIDFDTDPITFNIKHIDENGKIVDSTKTTIVFISNDTMLLNFLPTKNDKDKKTKTIKLVKRDSISEIPKQITEISESINKLYSNFSYNVSAFDNFDSDKLPIYGNMLELSIGLGIIKAYTMEYIFNVHNIQIININENEATVAYLLDFIKDDNIVKTVPIYTPVRKMNNEWRIYWANIFGKR